MNESATGSQEGPHIVVAGGGTGGHLYPGIAVVEAIDELKPECEFAFVGTEEGIEARVIPDREWAFHAMEVPPLQNKGVGEMLAEGWTLTKSGIRALSLVRRLDPALTIGVGGYASGPFTLASALSGRPTVLLEQNREPGMTNRILDRFVDAAFVSFENTCRELATSSCEAHGNPVRRSIRELARSYSYEAPETDEPFHLLITGGSGGARAFNERLPEALCGLGDDASHVVARHQYGRDRGDEVAGNYEEFAGKVETVAFIDDMAGAYEWCDLLICRAGGTTIAEVLALGVPSVFVPSPHVTEDQQTKNARAIAEAGAGIMLSGEAIGTSRATRLLHGLINNPVSLENIARKARQMSRGDAADAIARDCLNRISAA